MHDIQEIREKVKNFIVETSYVSAEQINDDTLIFAEGIMDSMGFISIIGFLEEAFSISAADNELIEANFESVDAISNYVLRKL